MRRGTCGGADGAGDGDLERAPDTADSAQVSMIAEVDLGDYRGPSQYSMADGSTMYSCNFDLARTDRSSTAWTTTE